VATHFHVFARTEDVSKIANLLNADFERKVKVSIH
jgi:hypothetical protein